MTKDNFVVILVTIFLSIALIFLLEGVGLFLRYKKILNEDSKVLEPLFLLIVLSKLKKLPFETGFFKKKPNKIHRKEILKVLLELDENSLEQLLELYKNEFGTGAARYARKTYQKWKIGKVVPIRQTFERFLIHLPKVMNYDLKCEVLRRLMSEYCGKEHYELKVYIDDWERNLEPLVQKIIDKPYTAELPMEIERQLKWLAEGEMQIAQEILRRSQVEEGKIAVSMLKQEFSNIEDLLKNMNGKPRITHDLKLPYGTIQLEIKRR